MSAAISVGAAAFDPETRTLYGPAGSVHLRPQDARVLAELARAAGGVVAKERLLALLYADRPPMWPSTNREDVLKTVVVRLRAELRRVGAAGTTIANVPRTGRRLVVAGDRVVRVYTPAQAAVADRAVAAMHGPGAIPYAGAV